MDTEVLVYVDLEGEPAIVGRLWKNTLQLWADAQHFLGIVLTEQGIRVGGAESARLLSEAVAACREALTVRTRDSLPQDWAVTQNNLERTLKR